MSVNKECSRSARAGRVLVAGMGNILRRDDGFGVEMARQLAERDELPAGARVIEVGIGGIHLVQELIDHYDVLVVIDAVERGRAAGTVYLLEPAVPDLAAWPVERRQDFLADMHYPGQGTGGPTAQGVYRRLPTGLQPGRRISGIGGPGGSRAGHRSQRTGAAGGAPRTAAVALAAGAAFG
jgi:hypothetical protein